MLDENYSIEVAKKIVQKTVINELFKKGMIDLCQCNTILKKLDESIVKLQSKFKVDDNMKKIVVKIPI